jgi:hypothetical protein
VPLDEGYAAFADFTNYYGANSKGSINSHGLTFGSSKNVYARSHFNPTVFAEAGDVRSSNAGSMVNQSIVPPGSTSQFQSSMGSRARLRLRTWQFSIPTETRETISTQQSVSLFQSDDDDLNHLTKVLRRSRRRYPGVAVRGLTRA